MSGTIVIPPNKRVNIKLSLVLPPPDEPYGFGFDHFNRKQFRVIAKLLDKIHDADLDIDKFFSLYGLYAYYKNQKHAVDLYMDSDICQWVYDDIELSEWMENYKKHFHQKFCVSHSQEENEYDRILKMEGVEKALDKIYQRRWYKNRK